MEFIDDTIVGMNYLRFSTIVQTTLGFGMSPRPSRIFIGKEWIPIT
jgi:hypothetical protein